MNPVLDRPSRSAPSPRPAAWPLPPGWPDEWPSPEQIGEGEAVALLETGSCLSQPVFHALYERTPPGFRAELVEGVVYVASPLSRRHGVPHLSFGWLLASYAFATPGVEASDNTSVVLTGAGEPQPDLYVRVRRDHGGRSRTFSREEGVRVESDDDGDYLTTGPEFVLEIARSSFTLDFQGKRRDYFSGGVREYVIANVVTRALHWFDFGSGTDRPVPVPEDGVVRSGCLPGLWIDGPALFDRRGADARATLERGLASPEHASFVARLAEAKAAHDAAADGGPEP